MFYLSAICHGFVFRNTSVFDYFDLNIQCFKLLKRGALISNSTSVCSPTKHADADNGLGRTKMKLYVKVCQLWAGCMWLFRVVTN